MNCKILIITNKKDYTTDFAIRRLHERKINFFRLNTEDFPLKYSSSINISNKKFYIELKSNKVSLNFEEIKGIWYRRPVKPQLSEITLSSDDKEFAIRESSEFLNNLWTILDNKNWVSNPNSLRMAERKVFQLKKAIEVGFDIPATSISNDPELLLDYYKNLKKQVSEAEKLRNGDRGWTSKEELIALKKQKLKIKEAINKSKS